MGEEELEVIRLLDDKRAELAALCRRYGVARLEVFGSAVRDDFDPPHSDLDFLVEFLPLSRGEHAEAYFGLRESLEALFGRPVDLVMTRAVKNPYFLQAIDQTRTVVYAA